MTLINGSMSAGPARTTRLLFSVMRWSTVRRACVPAALDFIFSSVLILVAIEVGRYLRVSDALELNAAAESDPPRARLGAGGDDGQVALQKNFSQALGDVPCPLHLPACAPRAA